MSKKILILGVNGFIGSHLTESILNKTDWEVYGMDMATNKLENVLEHERFHFLEGDITINREWIEYHVKKCDVVLPLVAIAIPVIYVQDPLRVFELDFEANLEIVRLCVRYGTRVVFPSTSEVYGMSSEPEFDEETSSLVLGPINKPRWIYSCSKQLLDRVIHAYGMKGQLQYTLFRPFNWYGPRLDNMFEPKEGSSRVLTQFVSNVLHGRDIKLVDGGQQRRCFTYIDDGIAGLLKIIENQNGCADSRIFNLGNPQANLSVAELAQLVVETIKTYPKYKTQAENTRILQVEAQEYYGQGYQDVLTRTPAIHNALQYLDWQPTVDFDTGLRKTLDYYLQNAPSELD
ncbi:MAG: bifunctional UDP-4-keto-pentose/UDP-xylose synthase [Gammaproteobacteria bacterium]